MFLVTRAKKRLLVADVGVNAAGQRRTVGAGAHGAYPVIDMRDWISESVGRRPNTIVQGILPGPIKPALRNDVVQERIAEIKPGAFGWIRTRRDRIINRDQAAVGGAQSGKIAGDFGVGRYGENRSDPVPLRVMLRVDEEEQLVVAVIHVGDSHRPSQSASELILREGRLANPGSVIEERVGVQDLIAQKLVKSAMKLVRSRFGREVDDAAREASELRRQVVRLHLEFLNGILSGRQPRMLK